MATTPLLSQGGSESCLRAKNEGLFCIGAKVGIREHVPSWKIFSPAGTFLSSLALGTKLIFKENNY